MTNDTDITRHIGSLVAEEKQLRAQLAAHQISPGVEHQRLAALEVELDQCWDLLRQREALRDNDADPDDAQVRPASVVENYEN
jgi:hypothetical protein